MNFWMLTVKEVPFPAPDRQVGKPQAEMREEKMKSFLRKSSILNVLWNKKNKKGISQ